MYRLALLPAVLALASCCLTPGSEGADAGPCAACPRDAGSADAGGCADCPDAGTRCTSDSDCGAGAYCAGAFTMCLDDRTAPLATAVPGLCHRNCQDGSCVCQDDADCPISSVAGAGGCGADGHCANYGVLCSNVTCPAACPIDQPLDSLCPICLCAACPAPDAGSAGSCDGTASLSGGCGRAAPFTVASATSTLDNGTIRIVLSSAQNCQSTLPSTVSFNALVIELPYYGALPTPEGFELGIDTGRASYVSWLTDGGGETFTDGTVTVDAVDLDAGTIAGSFTLDLGSACVLSGTFSTEPSSCCTEPQTCCQ